MEPKKVLWYFGRESKSKNYRIVSFSYLRAENGGNREECRKIYLCSHNLGRSSNVDDRCDSHVDSEVVDDVGRGGGCSRVWRRVIVDGEVRC